MQRIFKYFLLTTALLFSLTSTLFSSVDCQKVFNVQNFVQRFYVQVLDREAEHAGLDDWTNKLTSGQKSGADVAYGFAFSQEYLDKHSSNSSYLTTLYKSFFNREPDSAGLNYWLAQIAEGMSREEVLHGFVYSKEFEILSASYGIKAYEDESKGSKGLSSFIQRFYQVILGREADKAGLDDWVAKLSAGSATGADIAEGFVFSAEYDEQSKDDSAFLTTLYRAFFNREPDIAGLAGWKTALLSGTSRKEVLQGFLHSQEFVNLSNTYGIRAYEGATQAIPSTQTPNTLTEMPYAKAIVDHTSTTETNSLHFSATQSHANVGSLVCTLWSEKETLLSEETAYTTNTLAVGRHKLHLMVVDSQGMCASDSVVVTVKKDTVIPPPVDTTPPVLMLNGEATITLAQGATYTELGATATDDRDGNVDVLISGAVDTSKVDTYTLTYTARDSENNEATVTRSIMIVDVTPPVLTLNGETNVTLAQNTPYTELGATATDAVDGSVAVNISGSVDSATLGEYMLTYTATDSTGNGASVDRVVNVVSGEARIKTLTLTRPQTYKQQITPRTYLKQQRYKYTQIPIKVMAIYEDGQSEDVTDIVTWHYKDRKNMKCYDLGWCVLKSKDGTVWVSLDGVTSNTLHVEVDEEDETSKFVTVKIINNSKKQYPNRDAEIVFKPFKRPTADIKFKFKLKAEDKVLFKENISLKNELVFTTGSWYPKSINIKDFDTNNSNDYTIIIEPLISEDPFYNGKKPSDIIVHKKKNFKLIEPLIKEIRGAIRGVHIKFRVFSDEKNLKYELIDPPKGMKVSGTGYISINPTDYNYLKYIEGIDVEWDVPIDIEEKIYNITMKATDIDGVTQMITFPIKVPKTKTIETTLINNELIVTDKSSPLYGMKMKGHSGEDISKMRLRSVEYGDVWKKKMENKKPEDIVEHVVFILDDMPSALDVKMPEYMDSYSERINIGMHSYKYRGIGLDSGLWERATRQGFLYENTNGYVYLHKSNNSEIFFIVLEKAQNKGK